MIKLGECELDYPMMTRFKVYYKKKYMGEYTRTELLNKFGEKWLDKGHEEGVKLMKMRRKVGGGMDDLSKSGRLSQKYP